MPAGVAGLGEIPSGARDCRRLGAWLRYHDVTVNRRFCQPGCAEAQEAVRAERGYFARHRRRMQYSQFRARGLMIGSGPVEAACKVVVGQRLKGAGMRWSQAGADAILAARCTVLNHEPNRLDEVCKLAA